jgi:hypothetical protein
MGDLSATDLGCLFIPGNLAVSCLSGTHSRRLTAAQAEGNSNHSSSRQGYDHQNFGSVVVLR